MIYIDRHRTVDIFHKAYEAFVKAVFRLLSALPIGWFLGPDNPGGPAMQEELDRWAVETGVAIFNRRNSKAYDCSRRLLGHVQDLEKPSVSPDACGIASVHPSGTLQILETCGNLRSLLIDRPGNKKLAISSDGQFVVSVQQRGEDRALLLITEEGESELLPLVGEFVKPIESLSLCGNGSMLAVGSRESFMVFDLTRRVAVLQGSGRFPKLTPDGTGLAYVAKGRLVLQNVVTQGVVLPSGRRSVCGVGVWSPDGRYLVVGMPVALLTNQVRILEVATERTLELFNLGEVDYGTTFGWISRKLIAPL